MFDLKDFGDGAYCTQFWRQKLYFPKFSAKNCLSASVHLISLEILCSYRVECLKENNVFLAFLNFAKHLR